MAISSAYKWGRLRTLAKEAADAGQSLLDRLDAELARLDAATKSGAFVTGTSFNGASVSLATDRDLSPVSAHALVAELIQLHATATAALVAAGTPAPTDDQLRDWMLARFSAPVREYTKSYGNLRG